MRVVPGRTSRWRMPEAAPALSNSAPVPVFPGIEVVWRVTRRSMGSNAPEGSSRLVELIVRLDGLKDGVVTGSVRVGEGSATRLVETFERVSAEVIPDIRGEVHVECPGVLHATVAPGEGGSWRLVYARSPVLDALGVPGGRAEAIGVRVL